MCEIDHLTFSIVVVDSVSIFFGVFLSIGKFVAKQKAGFLEHGFRGTRRQKIHPLSQEFFLPVSNLRKPRRN